MGKPAPSWIDTSRADTSGLFSHDAQDDVQVSATFPESNPFGRMSYLVLSMSVVPGPMLILQ